jgi:hypothetical protein
MTDPATRVDESIELTSADRRVLQVFLDDGAAARLFHHHVAGAAGLGPGSSGIALARLERAGWLVMGVQEHGDVIPAREGRWFPPRFPAAEETLPPRAWWKLTPAGARLARAALSR